MLAMRMEPQEMHPEIPDGTAEETAALLMPYSGQANAWRNANGLDNVVAILATSPMVKKLPARKNELLHSFFRDDGLARKHGEPVTTWLVRYEEALARLKKVDIDLVALLPDIAGWQALNLAGLSEDRLE